MRTLVLTCRLSVWDTWILACRSMKIRSVKTQATESCQDFGSMDMFLESVSAGASQGIGSTGKGLDSGSA